MSDHFLVEADRRVIGIAVRVPGAGFRFFTSERDFKPLEAETFPHARALYRRAEQFAFEQQQHRAPEPHDTFH